MVFEIGGLVVVFLSVDRFGGFCGYDAYVLGFSFVIDVCFRLWWWGEACAFALACVLVLYC